MSGGSIGGEWFSGSVLRRDDFYPPHLEVGNLFCHHWRGRNEVGRHIVCRVCNVSSNARNRRGDARFILAHKHCSPLRHER